MNVKSLFTLYAQSSEGLVKYPFFLNIYGSCIPIIALSNKY